MRLIAALALLLAFAAPHHAAGAMRVGRVTWYPDAGVTYGETWTTAGRTAACGWGIPLWSTVTLPDGRSRICEDRIGSPATLFDVDVYGEPDVPAAMAPYCWGSGLNICYIQVSE